ncbi:MAG TPA: ATP-binding protein [Fimbriimonadaceae bacterium]|nr:ATP-binding protein [Fimbriimonadaceae bacterium]
MKAASVKTKLTIWNVGVLTLTLSALGFAVFYGARESLLSSVDKDLKTRAEHLVSRVTPFIGVPERRIRVLGIAKGSPRLAIPGVPHELSMLQVGPGEFEAINPTPQNNNDPTRSMIRPRILDKDGKNGAGERAYDMDAFRQAWNGHESFFETTVYNGTENEAVRVFSVPIRKNGKIERVLQYPQPLAATYQALGGLTLTLGFAIPLILLASAIGGAFLTGRALKPVREITGAAAEVGAESLDGRLEVKGHDEFSRLAQTFNGMLDRLQIAFTRMEQAVEQQRRFTADASHELRTPLTVIKANTSLALKGKRTSEDYQKTLAAVNAAADSMNRLVGDLLLLARSDTGKLEIAHEPTCLKPLLKEAIASVARPGVAEITLKMDDEGQEILGDGHSVIRVFVNLLENAARYTPEDGLIAIEQTRDDGEVIVIVRDTGVGIAPEHVPHLIDRFYRVDEARARAEGGSGLGLSICASIIEAHGGTMTIASVPDHGTTVTIRLPAA